MIRKCCGLVSSLLLVMVLFCGCAGNVVVMDAPAGPWAAKVELPRVLIIGDSISIGYTPLLKTLLKGKAEVVHNAGNAGPTTNGIKNLDVWLGDGKWDVIHINHGLHDLKFVDKNLKNVNTEAEGDYQVPVEQYAKNLEIIIERLKKTSATLIFATTTSWAGTITGPLRKAGDAERYNEAALRVMHKHGIAVNDLYALSLPQLDKLQRPKNVHFSPAGSMVLAEQVADMIETALGEKGAK